MAVQPIRKNCRNWVLLAVTGIALSSLIACTQGRNKPFQELVTDMRDQPALKEQDYHPTDMDRSSMKVPPEGTAPRGFVPYKYKGDPEAAGRNLKNPLAGDMSPEVVATGRLYYNRYCAVCHGEKGDGNGPVAPKFGGVVRDLTTQRVRDWPDGRIYHIITDGQGVMRPYDVQIPDLNHRWAIVNYLRNLQKQNPTD